MTELLGDGVVRLGTRFILNLSTSTVLDSLARIEHLDAPLLLFGHGEPWREGPAAAVASARRLGPS
jgi:hypothetical protein